MGDYNEVIKDLRELADKKGQGDLIETIIDSLLMF